MAEKFWNRGGGRGECECLVVLGSVRVVVRLTYELGGKRLWTVGSGRALAFMEMGERGLTD